jgi:pimeloyl-ACP methyl ester carboxylesterase
MTVPTQAAGLEQAKVEECWTTVDGVRLRYLQAGSGRPLVLLHGLLGYAFSWRFVMPMLAPHANVYALDMAGAGFSDGCAGLECSFRASAVRLLRFANQLGMDDFDLLGTSHGGAVAMTAAGMGRDGDLPSVRRLILVAPANPWSLYGSRLARFLIRPTPSLLFRTIVPRWKPLHRRLLRRLYGDPRKIRPGTLEGYVEPLKRAGSFEYPLHVLSTWHDDHRALETALRKIVEIPTLMIWGTLDSAVDPASAHTLCRYFRNCQLVEMEGVGHLPYEECPEQLSQLVIEFLNKPPV